MEFEPSPPFPTREAALGPGPRAPAWASALTSAAPRSHSRTQAHAARSARSQGRTDSDTNRLIIAKKKLFMEVDF